MVEGVVVREHIESADSEDSIRTAVACNEANYTNAFSLLITMYSISHVALAIRLPLERNTQPAMVPLCLSLMEVIRYAQLLNV